MRELVHVHASPLAPTKISGYIDVQYAECSAPLYVVFDGCFPRTGPRFIMAAFSVQQGSLLVQRVGAGSTKTYPQSAITEEATATVGTAEHYPIDLTLLLSVSQVFISA